MRHFITFRGISNGSDLTLDVSAICNSNNTQIKKPRCTTTFQSAASSASFVVGWTPDKIADPYDGTLIDRDSLYRTCIEAMLTCIETKADMNVKILDDTRLKTEFRGYIDPTEISLSRTKIPGTIAISCKDYTTDLDKKIGLNIVRENVPLNELVEELLELCFGTGQHELVGTGADGIVGTDASDTVLLGIHRTLSSLPSSLIVERFVVTEEDSTTYRQAIDRLLLEKGIGCVLHYLHSVNKFEIVPCIPDEVDDTNLRTVNFMANSELVTRTGVYGHDGILLKWPTIEERLNDNVYAESIDPKFDSSLGYIGTIIQNGSYYPEDGDIVKTKQEYRRSDRAFVTGESRLKNSDIDLLYAKSAELGIIATPVTMRSRGTVADLDTLEALSDPKLGDYAYVSDAQVASYRAYNGSGWEYADTPSLTDGVGNVYEYKGTVASKSALPLNPDTGDYYKCADTGYYWCWMDAQWQRKISEFCFPVLNTSYFNMEDGNPAFYPCSMWALGRNRSGGMVNLQALSVTATSVARTKINKTTQPSIIKDAEEYEAQYITDQSSAEAFALFLYNSHRISCTTCTWYEWDGQRTPLSVLGERVRVEYMSGNTAVFCVIQIDDMPVNRLSRKYRVTAIFVSGFASSFSGNHEAAVAPTVINRREAVAQQVSYACTDSGVTVPSDNEWSSQRSVQQGKYLWTRTTTTYSDSTTSTSYNVVYNPADAEIFDFYLGDSSFFRNRRLSENQEIAITKDIQGLTGYTLAFSCYCDGILNNSLLDSTSDATKLTIPLNNPYTNIKVVMSAVPPTVHDPVEHSISVIDQTLKDNNFGTWQPVQSGGQTYVLPDHFVADGKINSILEGDYFVAGLSFATDADDVTPLGTEDPQALGWYERHGSGTDSDPYWWEKSSDTVVDGTKTYGEAVSTATYILGVPYIYSSGSWHNAMQATMDNSMRMLGALSAILTSGTDVPSVSALYGWFENLVALDAVIQNLFSQAITILTGGYIKGGDRYDSSGNVADWTKNGFWFGANGKLKALLQSDDDGNTLVGTRVAMNTNHGKYNTAVGYECLYSAVTDAKWNVAMGYQCLYSLTTGDYNVGIGYQAAQNMTTSQDNVAVGYRCLQNTITSWNTAVGAFALQNNTVGGYNTAFGCYALSGSSTGSNNTAIGFQAMNYGGSGSKNTAVGYEALMVGYSGSDNVAVGNEAAYNVSAGAKNTAVGSCALHAASVGTLNTAIGFEALKTVEGTFNTAVGGQALSAAVSGQANTAVGYRALFTVTKGSHNVAIGSGADVYSPTGDRQISINNAIIGLEFKSGRQKKDIYNVLLSYISSIGEITCFGMYEDHAINRMLYNGANSITLYSNNSSYSIGYNNVTTISKRAVLVFVNPLLTSDTSEDCLAT